jgi:DNA repair exonuclease SbcCD nuclease subunit
MSDKKIGERLKFLHCSDLHLDTPYIGLSPDKSDERRAALRQTFRRLMEYVRNAGIQYVLMSGDIFDIKHATGATAELFIREIRSTPDTNFIIAPGKSDCIESNPIYQSGRLPANCHVFDSENLSRFDFADDKVTIYGWGFRNGSIKESPLYDKHVDDVARINIVCGYADVDGDVNSDSCPISTADLRKFGADYYALGSRHEGSDFIKLDDSMYAYAGALESIGFEEPGMGGAKLISVKYRSGELSIDAKSMTFGHVRFEREVVDITGVNTNNEIMNIVSRLVNDKKYGAETALIIEFVGYVEPRFMVPSNLGSDTFGLYSFDMVDKTLPLYGTEYLRRDMSVKGDVFRQLLPILEGGTEEEKLLAARAFREALAALESRDIET